MSLALWSERLGLPHPIRVVDETGSTNADLRALAAQGAPHGTALVASRQTAGRGRMGRTWLTPPGSLAVSVLLRPPLSLAMAPSVGLAASVAVAEACGPAYRIKWPNDVLAPDGTKVAGILAEVEADGRAIRWLVVGVGVNVTGAPDLTTASALSDHGPAPDRDRLAAELVAGILAAVDRLGRVPGEVLGRWRALSATVGTRVRIGALEGWAVGLDPDGALRVRDDAGVEHRVVAGDVG